VKIKKLRCNKGIGGEKIVAGVVGLFLIMAVYYLGDPILHGRLYTEAHGEKAELADAWLRGWTTIIPVFIGACLLMILMGGRKTDYPSRYQYLR
jgi:hypothetical protein